MPNGRALRLAKIENENVTWGATIPEKQGESQAYDLALGDKKGLVVWSEDSPERGLIQASTFDLSNLASATPARTISPNAVDAESPRLAARPGGYWLSYIARRGGDDQDAHYVAEEIGYRWIEVVPLDANGSPAGTARGVTPHDGHVIAFDAISSDDGGELIIWREDDTPSGSAGGRVVRAAVHPSSVSAPAAVMEDDVGAGVPALLAGWVAIADAADATRIAPLSPSGELLAPPLADAWIGSGEPIAAAGETVLIAKPEGRVVKLLVGRCSRAVP
jgi:hypothetical protein